MTGTLHGYQYAIVPEWLIDADVSDRAVRLWCVLARHANGDGEAFPKRSTLAARLGCSAGTVDRALDELVAAEAITVQARYRDDGGRSSNSYWLWPSTPDQFTLAVDPPDHTRRGPLSTSDEGASPPVMTHEREPLNESQKNETAMSPDDERKALARKVVQRLWDNVDPKPAVKFIALVKIVESFLTAGWDPMPLYEALKRTRAYTTNAIEFELRGGRTPPPATTGPRRVVAPDEEAQRRAAPAGRIMNL